MVKAIAVTFNIHTDLHTLNEYYTSELMHNRYRQNNMLQDKGYKEFDQKEFDKLKEDAIDLENAIQAINNVITQL